MIGRYFLHEAYEAWRQQEDFTAFELQDIDTAFNAITNINYSQVVDLPGVGISVTAHSAGHMIGGTIWRITKDGENVVYAVDYNHRREWHLNSSALDTLTWPSVLITDTLNAAYTAPKRRDVLGRLLAAVRESVEARGNVLVCSDTGGRYVCVCACACVCACVCMCVCVCVCVCRCVPSPPPSLHAALSRFV